MMLINGIASTQLDALDRGLHYGDGVFSTLRVHDGEPVLWERHVQRLSGDCARLGISMPNAVLLQSEARHVCAGAAQGVLKMIVTRGSGGRGYQPPPMGTSTRIVKLYPWPDYPVEHWTRGVAIRVNATRLGRNVALAGIKHLNRLEQVLARSEWNDPAISEGLMLDEQGRVIEATAANVFMVRNGELLTPRLDACGVSGVMRGTIIEIAARLGVPVQESQLELTEVRAADELFITNSVIGLWPVRDIDATIKKIGPLTQRIAATLAESIPVYA